MIRKAIIIVLTLAAVGTGLAWYRSHSTGDMVGVSITEQSYVTLFSGIGIIRIDCFRVAEVPVLDFNGDGNVDLYDFALFQADFGGDVDLHYFAWFQENFTGPLP